MDKNSIRGLEQILSEKYRISPHKIPYYLKWMQKFQRFHSKKRNIADSRELFVEKISTYLQNWQIDQAEKAISIFISLLQGKEAKDTRSHISETWDSIIFKMRNEIRLQNKSLQTERSYLYWVRRLIKYKDSSDPSNIDQKDVKDFLSRMKNPYTLMAKLIYGGGLRLSECLKIRIKDLDYENAILIIKSGKGDKDRQTLLSIQVISELQEHLIKIKKYFEEDRLYNNIQF